MVGSPAGQKGAPNDHGGAGTPPPARSPPTGLLAPTGGCAGAAGHAALSLPGLKRKAVAAPPNGTPGEKYGGVLELETTVGEEVRLGARPRPRPGVSAPGENTNSISDVPTRQRSLHGANEPANRIASAARKNSGGKRATQQRLRLQVCSPLWSLCLTPLRAYMSGTPQKSPGGGGGAYENSPRPRDDAPPYCTRHSLPASLLQTKTTAKGNQGRWFWTCSVRGSDACPFFEWSDSTAPSSHRKRKAGAEDPGTTPGTTPSATPGATSSTKVYLTLVAEPGRFAAVSDYNTDLVECFRSLRSEGARWEPAEKHWSFPDGARDALLDRLRQSVPAGGTPYEVQQVPAFVQDLLASHYAQHAPQKDVADRLARRKLGA